jgi:hypothetical protein
MPDDNTVLPPLCFLLLFCANLTCREFGLPSKLLVRSLHVQIIKTWRFKSKVYIMYLYIWHSRFPQVYDAFSNQTSATGLIRFGAV